MIESSGYRRVAYVLRGDPVLCDLVTLPSWTNTSTTLLATYVTSLQASICSQGTLYSLLKVSIHCKWWTEELHSQSYRKVCIIHTLSPLNLSLSLTLQRVRKVGTPRMLSDCGESHPNTYVHVW